MAKCPFFSYYKIETLELPGEALGTYQEVDCKGADCQLWDPDNGRCGIVTSNLISSPGKSAVPKAVKLVSEYMGSEDMDGNGKVYGVDFHISPADPNRPPMLANLPEEGSPMLWSEYIAEVES
jgi:hypothetical protein